MPPREIHVLGAGILGVWQAFRLATAGHRVTLHEVSPTPFTGAASRYAGAMLAPWCEAEAAPAIVRDLGEQALALWRAAVPDIVWQGTLVVAAARDRSELVRFARLTTAHRTLDREAIGALEPDLDGRFAEGLLFPGEGHMDPLLALDVLLGRACEAGCRLQLGQAVTPADLPDGLLVDCRGWAAREELPDLRAVRGERLLLRAPDVALTRCVRLLHPRHPLYVVPWADRRYMVGATVIESDDAGPATVRSAMELLGAAYAVHPGFAEAEILEIGAGVRPAFPDNVPRAIIRGRIINVNGAFRHGFLLGPVLADAVAGWVATGAAHPLVRQD